MQTAPTQPPFREPLDNANFIEYIISLNSGFVAQKIAGWRVPGTMEAQEFTHVHISVDDSLDLGVQHKHTVLLHLRLSACQDIMICRCPP